MDCAHTLAQAHIGDSISSAFVCWLKMEEIPKCAHTPKKKECRKTNSKNNTLYFNINAIMFIYLHLQLISYLVYFHKMSCIYIHICVRVRVRVCVPSEMHPNAFISFRINFTIEIFFFSSKYPFDLVWVDGNLVANPL